MKYRRNAEQTKGENNCRTVKKTRFIEQRRSGKNRFIYVVGCLIIHFIFQGGWEVLGRTIVLRGSSGNLNRGNCNFHLVAARETRVAGWCSGKHRVFCIQVGACINPVGAGIFRELVLPSSGC